MRRRKVNRKRRWRPTRSGTRKRSSTNPRARLRRLQRRRHRRLQRARRELDYLHDLGVTALWLLPFYPSPLRDGGYDIADYTNINPAYGTLKTSRGC